MSPVYASPASNRSSMGDEMMPNCSNCGRPNGILAYGANEQEAIPLCIDCYEKLQSVLLQQAHFHQYAAWEAEQQLNDHWEGFGISVPRRPPPPPPHQRGATTTLNSINVSGGQVGSINTGAIGTFALTVSQLKQTGQDDLAASLNALITGVLASPEFSDAVKNEIIEHLNAVAEQAKEQPQERKVMLGRTLVRRLEELLSNASSVGKLWESVSHLLANLF